MNNYFSQWSSQELLSMHGIENDMNDEEEQTFEHDIDENDCKDDENECPKCLNGCNYCLT